ncbi:MAG: hypothetical protein WAM54_12555, partial [Nitrososphaeraceae archaeon]
IPEYLFLAFTVFIYSEYIYQRSTVLSNISSKMLRLLAANFKNIQLLQLISSPYNGSKIT